MKIATFTDHITTPSSRFRIRQYFPMLDANGISVHDYHRRFSTETAGDADGNRRIRESLPLMARAAIHESANVLYRSIEAISSNKYDAVWLSRQLVIGYPTFEFVIRKPIIYDIDDAIFLSGKASYCQFKIVAKRACAVIAGNDFLAEAASRHSKNIHIVPTAVDTRRWFPSPSAKVDRHANSCDFRIGWSGTSSSFRFFIPLEQGIKRFLADFPSSRLVIMSDRFPRELRALEPHIEFIKWNQDDEVRFVQSLDVGLMPVKDDLWSKGKCAYKMLLYAACGIPVIATPVGVNKDVLAEADIGLGPTQPSEWYEAMRLFFNDRSMGKRLGGNGVKLVQDRYSVDACAPVIEKIIRTCV